MQEKETEKRESVWKAEKFVCRKQKEVGGLKLAVINEEEKFEIDKKIK